MRYFSTFSGIGGFELGIIKAYENNRPNIRDRTKDIREDLPDTSEQQNGVTCVGYSEIDKYATTIYSKHFPEHKNYGDITKINADELPDFQLLVGGFPCQAFSIAGKRRGFEDTRGTMFFELARILKAKQPKYFVFENVKGLLSHDNGNTFKTIIATITELGYDCQWQVLNSKNFGVPQNRERVFIVGHLRGTSRPEVFPIRESNAKDIVQLNNPTHSNGRLYGTDGISPTLNTMQGGNRQPKIFDDYNQKWRNDYLTCTLTPNTGSQSERNGQKVFDGIKIRRLTPTECERLQGFPDGWTEGVSDTQRYKTLGNAVTTNVVAEVIKRLI